MKNIISANNLSKIYKNKPAVDSISLNIEKGEIYALIGQNGAGKTTLMKLLTGFVKGNSGSIKKEVERVGVLIETPGLMLNLTALDNLKAKGLCYGVNEVEHFKKILTFVGLEGCEKKKVKKFSLGMKQRLGLALALVGEPEILVLDEPTNGLDPKGIKEFRELLLKLNREKKITIIISSHILEELSKVASTYVFIHKGKILQEITSYELKEHCNRVSMDLEDYYFSLIGGSHD